MKNQLASLASALLLATALFAGCSDSMVSPLDEGTVGTASTDPYSMSKVNEQELTDFSEAPTAAEIMSNPADYSLPESAFGKGPKGGRKGGGGRWFDRCKGREFGRPAAVNYRRLVKALSLTSEQDSLLRVFIGNFRDCSAGDFETYRTSRQGLFDTLKVSVSAIRAQVEGGTLDTASAKAQIEGAVTAYKAAVTALNDTLRAAVEGCRGTFITSFEAILTPEQLAIWNTIKD